MGVFFSLELKNFLSLRNILRLKFYLIRRSYYCQIKLNDENFPFEIMAELKTYVFSTGGEHFYSISLSSK